MPTRQFLQGERNRRMHNVFRVLQKQDGAIADINSRVTTTSSPTPENGPAAPHMRRVVPTAASPTPITDRQTSQPFQPLTITVHARRGSSGTATADSCVDAHIHLCASVAQRISIRLNISGTQADRRTVIDVTAARRCASPISGSIV